MKATGNSGGFFYSRIVTAKAKRMNSGPEAVSLRMPMKIASVGESSHPRNDEFKKNARNFLRACCYRYAQIYLL